jgi:hypothetical protein
MKQVVVTLKGKEVDLDFNTTASYDKSLCLQCNYMGFNYSDGPFKAEITSDTKVSSEIKVETNDSSSEKSKKDKTTGSNDSTYGSPKGGSDDVASVLHEFGYGDEGGPDGSSTGKKIKREVKHIIKEGESYIAEDLSKPVFDFSKPRVVDLDEAKADIIKPIEDVSQIDELYEKYQEDFAPKKPTEIQPVSPTERGRRRRKAKKEKAKTIPKGQAAKKE